MLNTWTHHMHTPHMTIAHVYHVFSYSLAPDIGMPPNS